MYLWITFRSGLNSGPSPKEIYPVPADMTFIRKGVFAEIGKLRISRGDGLKLGALNPVTSPKKRRQREKDM